MVVILVKGIIVPVDAVGAGLHIGYAVFGIIHTDGLTLHLTTLSFLTSFGTTIITCCAAPDEGGSLTYASGSTIQHPYVKELH